MLRLLNHKRTYIVVVHKPTYGMSRSSQNLTTQHMNKKLSEALIIQNP